MSKALTWDTVTAYHGTPLTPNALLEQLAKDGCSFCVSYYRPDQIELIDSLGVHYFIDNGAFSAWQEAERAKAGGKASKRRSRLVRVDGEVIFDSAYWASFYDFCRRWVLNGGAAWFVIPDVIGGGTQEQDALINECPAELLPFAVPVWHMDEPVSRLVALLKRFGRACIGSTAEYRTIGSVAWRERMDEAFDAVAEEFGPDGIPPIHMLRGMQCLTPSFDYPFVSVDSADVARNHNRIKRRAGKDRHIWGARQKAVRWDNLARRRPVRRWVPRHMRQRALNFGAAA